LNPNFWFYFLGYLGFVIIAFSVRLLFDTGAPKYIPPLMIGSVFVTIACLLLGIFSRLYTGAIIVSIFFFIAFLWKLIETRNEEKN